jgi:hypothetical protein
MERYLWLFMLAFAIVFVLTALHFDDKKKKLASSDK